MKKKIAWIALAALVIMQFFQIEKTNPDFDVNQDIFAIHKAPFEVTSLFKKACYDCHSYETTYPWYTSIAPVSFWIKGHINGGRKHLNFSEWGMYTEKRQAKKLEESIEYVTEKWMPLTSYTWGHREAKLNDEDRALMTSWMKKIQ
jgi:hypothetical protein